MASVPSVASVSDAYLNSKCCLSLWPLTGSSTGSTLPRIFLRLRISSSSRLFLGSSCGMNITIFSFGSPCNNKYARLPALKLVLRRLCASFLMPRLVSFFNILVIRVGIGRAYPCYHAMLYFLFAFRRCDVLSCRVSLWPGRDSFCHILLFSLHDHFVRCAELFPRRRVRFFVLFRRPPRAPAMFG